jgi:hypothetical protein
MGTRSPQWIAYLMLIFGALTACTPGATPAIPPPSIAVPTAALIAAPDLVCGPATQVRLQLQLSQNLPAEDPGAWELTGSDDEVVTQGEWIVRDGSVLVPFPDNAPLPTGQYRVRLDWQGAELVTHTFFVGPPYPTIEKLEVSVVPGGVPDSILWTQAPLQLFYVNYAFAGACTGAPYWISTRNATGETVCTHSGVLDSVEGEGAAPCYQEGETPFAIGQYETTITLPGEITRTVSFEIAAVEPTATPAPTRTPRPPSVICETTFTAAGITPEGEPYLPHSIFDWYTVTVYTGRMCRNLQPGTAWRSSWIRDGTLVREAEGLWEGPAMGVVWDVLTGVPANPFVPPGFYTVTLEIAGNSSEATFNVYEYPPASRTD